MRLMRIGWATVTALTLSLTLSGCLQARGVVLPPGSEDLAPCPITQISIDELSEVGEPGCDLTGSSVTFPDGSPQLTIASIGAAFSQGDGTGRETVITNCGIPGIGVAVIEHHRLVHLWATGPAALDLQKQQLEVDNVESD